MDEIWKSLCHLEESLFRMERQIDGEDDDPALIADIELAERRLRSLERTRPVFSGEGILPQP